MLKKMRRRYLAVKTDCDRSLNSTELMNAVWTAFLKLYGEYGACETSLALIDYDAQKNLAVLRTSHTTVEKVRVALASITEIDGTAAAIHVLKVSGTIKALLKKIKQ